MKVTPQQQTREQMAWTDVGHTAIRPGAAWTLIVLFLAVIYAVPLHQHIAEWRTARQQALPWEPGSLELVRQLPDITKPVRERGLRLSAILDTNRQFLRAISEQEDQLEDDSLLGQQIRPTMQRLFSQHLGVGNEQAYIGRDGWIFYRPGMDYLTGPGFLDERQLARRAAQGSEWVAAPQPDPRKAILDFHRQLEARGITLIVMPTPIKPSIHPEAFTPRLHDRTTPLQNVSYPAFITELEAAGIQVFDPSAILMERKETQPQYLATDTHWRPEAMEAVAKYLAQTFIPSLEGYAKHAPKIPSSEGYAKRGVGSPCTTNNTNTANSTNQPQNQTYPPRPTATPPGRGTSDIPSSEGSAKRGVGLPSTASEERRPIPLAAMGDIALMLDLPDDQDLFPPEAVTLNQVLTEEGQFWRPSPAAAVLVLGDSFSNIYSLEPMGWGESAGFVEQLSYYLNAPVDRLVRNDSGAFATRDMLRRELARGRDRLEGKKYVIWQFAARELAVGDWRIIPMDLREPPESRFVVPDEGQTLTVRGVVQDISNVPRPGTVPYRDHVVSVHLVDLPDEGQAVVYLQSMKDNEWTRAARLRPGEEITVTLRPWHEVADLYEAINRSELDDFELQLQEPCWGLLADQ